ncbi:MAG: hypothetical protein LBF41_08480, partial [Deltaproteobacteria bacterium]|nr:hypothetical protein [Deltaproteobacteria bacterium]
MSKRITNACAIFSLSAALCFFFASGTALFGAELSMGDIDNYIKLLSQKDNEGRGRVVYEMMLKTRDTPDTIQKKTTIIAMIVTRLSLEET